MEKKIAVIDLICEKHPSYGVEKGWSEYTGGLKDGGRWYFRKMLDISIEELQSFLDGIITEENNSLTPLTEQELADSKIICRLPSGVFTNALELERMKEFEKGYMQEIFFGNIQK